MVRLVRVQHRAETVPDVLAHVPYLHQFIWHGGEPYLIKRFRQFVDSFDMNINPNLTFGFTTNGTMLTAKELDKLRKFPRINASISFDSFDKDTFEKIREGASYERVLTNTLNAIRRFDKESFVISCGMIICKSNMLKLADNLRFALENNIGLNLSPVLVYPVIEQLDVFEDFEKESEGWLEQLDKAEALICQGKALNAEAFARIDPTGMIQELRAIFSRAAATYDSCTSIRVLIEDPHATLFRMTLPGIIVYSNSDTIKPIAYLALRKAREPLRLNISGAYSPNDLHWRLVHNLLEPHGIIGGAQLEDVLRDGQITVRLPRFHSQVRPRNFEYANYGETTPQGLVVINSTDINKEYASIKDRGSTVTSD
jgi:hypothetical protein